MKYGIVRFPGSCDETDALTAARRLGDAEILWHSERDLRCPLEQGQRLFAWFNCVGCHANGGGGMGPPLMDAEWIYGSDPGQIYRTILEGRPNGMPSFGGRIPDSQIWQIVAYVRSLGGLTPATVRASRADHMMTFPESQILMEAAKPKQSFLPPASKQP